MTHHYDDHPGQGDHIINQALAILESRQRHLGHAFTQPKAAADFVDPFSDAFFFPRPEERFGNRIPAVATSAHTWCQAVGPAETQPVVTTILATLDALLRVKSLFECC